MSHRPGWIIVTCGPSAGELVVRDRPRRGSSTVPGPIRLAHDANLGASRRAVSASSSGSTRVSPTTGMKLVSPFQRGTTCQCRWSGMPAPATRAQVQPHVEPVRVRSVAQRADRSLEQRLHLHVLIGGEILEVARVPAGARSAGARGCTGTCSARRRRDCRVASTRSGSRSGTTQKTHAPSSSGSPRDAELDVLPCARGSRGDPLRVGLRSRSARARARLDFHEQRGRPGRSNDTPSCSVAGTIAHGVGAGLHLLVAHHHRVRRLHQLRGADLLADRFLRIVDHARAGPAAFAFVGELLAVLDVAVGDRRRTGAARATSHSGNAPA